MPPRPSTRGRAAASSRAPAAPSRLPRRAPRSASRRPPSARYRYRAGPPRPPSPGAGSTSSRSPPHRRFSPPEATGKSARGRSDPTTHRLAVRLHRRSARGAGFRCITVRRKRGGGRRIILTTIPSGEEPCPQPTSALPARSSRHDYCAPPSRCRPYQAAPSGCWVSDMLKSAKSERTVPAYPSSASVRRTPRC